MTVTRFLRWTPIISYMWGDGVSLPLRTGALIVNVGHYVKMFTSKDTSETLTYIITFVSFIYIVEISFLWKFIISVGRMRLPYSHFSWWPPFLTLIILGYTSSALLIFIKYKCTTYFHLHPIINSLYFYWFTYYVLTCYPSSHCCLAVVPSAHIKAHTQPFVRGV